MTVLLDGGMGRAEALPCALQIHPSVLYPAELIDKFQENVAVNRGANIIVLSDVSEAINWLMSLTKPSMATE